MARRNIPEGLIGSGFGKRFVRLGLVIMRRSENGNGGPKNGKHN